MIVNGDILRRPPRKVPVGKTVILISLWDRLCHVKRLSRPKEGTDSLAFSRVVYHKVGRLFLRFHHGMCWDQMD